MRLCIAVSDHIYDLLKTEAEKLGVTTASYVAFIIADYYKVIKINREIN